MDPETVRVTFRCDCDDALAIGEDWLGQDDNVRTFNHETKEKAAQ